MQVNSRGGSSPPSRAWSLLGGAVACIGSWSECVSGTTSRSRLWISRLTPEGKRDFLFQSVEGPVPVFDWHGDTFDLPEGAVLLASSKQYLHQAFRFGVCAYGLQFHVEPVSETWSGWHEQLSKQLAGEDDPRRSQFAEVGRKLIARFFDTALSQGISVSDGFH
jgi:GMP synthase-like glutamine amidotransferase